MTPFGLLFGLLFAFPTWAGYSLADLQVLTQEEIFEEFFDHALDIRPSERQDEWKKMTTKMADGYGRQILSKNEISRSHFTKIESIYTWPVLASDDLFKLHRQDIGIKYLRKCLKEADPCWNDVKSFWEADQKNPEVAFKLAEMTFPMASKAIPTWTFLEVAIKSPLSEFYCKKDFVLEALWEKFEIDYVRLANNGSLLKKIDQTTHPECLLSFNQRTLQKLHRPERLTDRELAFQLLAAQGKMTESLSDFFYTVYLLENPSKGELFNYAWNRLVELSKSSNRREEVLKKIKALDPLPDSLFSTLDEVKKRAILSHFKSKFPEYLHYYADQCLLYYGGQEAFPKGNPTMKCQNLMEQEAAKSLVGEEKVMRFYQIRSI